MSIYLAIDLGTTGCRSILFNSKLEEISESYQEYGLIIVERPSKNGVSFNLPSHIVNCKI